MNIDDFFKNWSAICDAHENCSGCPLEDDELICFACGNLERAIKELESIISKREKTT